MSKYWDEQMEHIPTREYYETIKRILKDLPIRNVLEIGTGWGISGSAFMESNIESLTTIDPNHEAEYGKKALAEIYEKQGSKKIEVLTGYSQEILPMLINENRKFDLIYIDGNHSYDGCIYDLLMADRLLQPGGFILMDDFLHHKNLRGETDPEAYGIVKAVREYLIKSQKTATIFPTKVNAFILI